MDFSNQIKQIKTQQINDFMSNFTDLNEIDVSVIEEGLQNILGELPAVDFEYIVETPLNETTGEPIRRKKLEKINIFYTYINENNSISASKISYIVN